MTLKDRQAVFCQNVGLLIGYVNSQPGWQMTFGEGERPPWVAKIYEQQGKGIANSLHIDRLAHDFHFYKDGAYITDIAMLKPFADYWKTLDADNRWGGDFKKMVDGVLKPDPDVFHFSMTYGGRQ